MKTRIKTSTMVRKVVFVSLDDKSIIGLLTAAGMIPEGASPQVIFRVPCGGDYSGMDVEVDESHPVTVRWEESHYSEEP